MDTSKQRSGFGQGSGPKVGLANGSPTRRPKRELRLDIEGVGGVICKWGPSPNFERPTELTKSAAASRNTE